MRQVAQPSASKPWRVRGIAVSLVLPLFALVGPAAAAPHATSDHGPLRVCASCAYTGVSEALSAALEREGEDMITVEAGQYRDPITISSDVRLRGAGAAETTLGYITIEAGVEASLADVTVTGRPGATTFGDRSGIDNSGDLTLRDSVVTHNFVLSTNGACGGMTNRASGVLSVRNSTVSDNQLVGLDGAGICNRGVAVLRGSTVSGNASDPFGGGIANSGLMAIADSAITGNRALAGGGGILNTGVLGLRGTTVTANSATIGGGGGISNRNGALEVPGSSITGNTAPFSAGILNVGGTVVIKDSTVQT